LGVNHRGEGARGALSPADFWETPLGKVSIEHDLSKELEKRCDFLESDERSHAHEHSIEVQLPFLQTILDNFVLLPVALSHLSAEECRQLGRAIACAYETATLSGNKTIIIASSDLNHYIPPERIEKLDRTALEPVLALDAPRLLDTIEHTEMTMCGVVPTAVLLFAAEALRAKRARLLKYCHSGDATPMDTVVGYASVSVEL
jgi:AmmeMemoRadiSam system protein B